MNVTFGIRGSKLLWTAAMLAGSIAGSAASAASFTSISAGVTNTVVEDFEAFTGEGFSPGASVAGTLDSNAFTVFASFSNATFLGGTATSGVFDQGLSAGGVTVGGVHAFQIAPDDVGLGVQPTGSLFTPGSISFFVLNDTGSTIDRVSLAFEIFAFNDQDRSVSVDVTSGVLLPAGGGTLVIGDDLPFGSPVTTPLDEDVSPTWESLVAFDETFDLTPVSSGSSVGLVGPGEFFVTIFDFDDAGGSGSRDELAISSITVTGIDSSAISVIPTPAALGIGAIGMLGLLRRRTGRV